MVLLSAPLRALLSAEGSLLFGPELPGADESRRPPAASPALPQRRNQGAAVGPAALHLPGPVSIFVPSLPLSALMWSSAVTADWTADVTWFLCRHQVTGRRAALPRLPS